MGTGQDVILGTDKVKDALLTKLADDLVELFAILTEVEAARDGESTLLAQIDLLQASVLAVTAANGSLVSSNDTTPGFINGKVIAGTNIAGTEGSDGGNETFTLDGTAFADGEGITSSLAAGTLTIACEDAAWNNKGVATFDRTDFVFFAGAVSRIGHAELVKIQTASPYTVTVADLTGNTIILNTSAGGATELLLPAGAAGYALGVYVDAAQYLKITANGSETIRYNATQGAAGGYIRENTIGRYVYLRWLGSEWVITEMVGTWNMDA